MHDGVYLPLYFHRLHLHLWFIFRRTYSFLYVTEDINRSDALCLDRLESLITWIRRLQMKSPSVQTDAMLVQWPYGILLMFLSSIDPCIILKKIKSCALQIIYRSDFGQRYKKLNPWSFANWTTTKVLFYHWAAVC